MCNPDDRKSSRSYRYFTVIKRKLIKLWHHHRHMKIHPRFDNLQADVNQVVDVMKDNLEKVLERDAKLTTLENRADILQTGASQFTTNANKLKRKYWWKNIKMWAILIILIIVLIIIIVVAVTQSVKGGDSSGNKYEFEGSILFNEDIIRVIFHMLTLLYIPSVVISVHFTQNMSTNGGGGAAAPAAGGGGSKRLAQQQAQVDEVVDIMRQNVDKVLERDKNLSLLDDRADKLQHNAAQFEQHAGKLKRKYWWKNMKMMIIMGVVGTIFAIVVIGWIASKVKEVAPAPPAAEATTPIAVVNNAEANSAAGSASGNAGRKVTKAHKKKKKTKTTKAVSTTTPTNNDGGRSPDGDENEEEEEDAKPSGRRNRRALLHF
ncbi:unnamed protein product [Adineta ricciae]|uniref:V-SNARE coiled-coil homology domain-containing protein n=1 Tax=Adineta ricciae TaxID=249248 RepID=A0A814A9Z2_ADIRI|nr:unnamed protein product [Adineta ricciae]